MGAGKLSRLLKFTVVACCSLPLQSLCAGASFSHAFVQNSNAELCLEILLAHIQLCTTVFRMRFNILCQHTGLTFKAVDRVLSTGFQTRRIETKHPTGC